MNPKVDTYIQHARYWQQELERLREILLDCELTEELKWGAPCYTFQQKNIVVMGELKDYCALGFFKGALLQDTHGILTRPGENTQAARTIRFKSVREIAELEAVVKAYVFEAIEVERAGLKVAFKDTPAFDIPVEFQQKMDEMPPLKAAFEALTPGRQRAYLLHFAAPKQSETRTARVEKCMEQILRGKGLNDDYKR